MAKRKRVRKPKRAATRPAPDIERATTADLLRPWLLGAACALWVARPLFPSESAAHEGDGLPVVMLWIALAVFWLLGLIGQRQFRLRFGWTDAAVGLLIGLHTIAAVWGAVHGSARPAVNMLWEWIAFGLCFFLARQLVVGRRETRALVAVMIALAVALAGYGLYQYFYEMPATRAVYEADPDGALREAGMWFEPGSPQRVMFENRLQSTEPIATFALTNSLAGYLAPWLVVAAGIAIGAGWGRRRLGTPLAVAVCALPVAACLLLTKSRSGYIAVTLGLLLLLVLPLVRMMFRWLRNHLGPRLAVAGTAVGATVAASIVVSLAVGLIAAAVAVGSLDPQVLSEAPKSLVYRVQYWESSVRMIADHPIAGCGPGNFQETYTIYKLPEASEEIADPHNFLLEIWATAGTPAMLAVVAVLGCFGFALVKHHGSRPEGPFGEPSPATVRDLPWPVIAGGAAGFLLAIPLGLVSSAPPGMAAVPLGFPLAAGAVALLWPWVREGPLPVGLMAVGLAVMLVNLLAAGGIGFPGVAGSLWLFMALGLNAAQPEGGRMLPRSVAVAGLVVAMTLAVTCYSTAYGPVLRCRGAMQAAQGRLAEERPQEAEAYLLRAAAADPLAAQPWKELASLAFRRWQQTRTPEALQRFEMSTKTALQLAPNSSPTWHVVGDRYAEIFGHTRQKRHIEQAVNAYRRAVELYPNSGLYRAKLAVALRAAGDEPGFRKQAAAAIRLDGLTPHADKKLPDELRRALSRSSSRNN